MSTKYQKLPTEEKKKNLEASRKASDTVLPDVVPTAECKCVNCNCAKLPSGVNPEEIDESIEINPETLRVMTYINFYLMVILAIAITKYFVPQELLDDSPLVRALGYNNICIFWDYNPSMWIIAMVYPFVEIPLLLYIVLNWLRQREDFKNGRTNVPYWYYHVITVTTGLELVLFSWFRMIFVNRAFNPNAVSDGNPSPIDALAKYSADGIAGHTLPFAGFQLAMTLNAMQNFAYYGFHTTVFTGKMALLSKAYILAMVLVTIAKFVVTWSQICKYNKWFDICYDIAFDLRDPSRTHMARAIDVAWSVLVALIPCFLATYLRRHSRPFKVHF
jgi:hypothetical protein